MVDEGTRTGAMLSTYAYHGPGVYEVIMKPITKGGAATSVRTNHYAEFYKGKLSPAQSDQFYDTNCEPDVR